MPNKQVQCIKLTQCGKLMSMLRSFTAALFVAYLSAQSLIFPQSTRFRGPPLDESPSHILGQFPIDHCAVDVLLFFSRSGVRVGRRSSTGNAVAGQLAPGFESQPLRQTFNTRAYTSISPDISSDQTAHLDCSSDRGHCCACDTV